MANVIYNLAATGGSYFGPAILNYTTYNYIIGNPDAAYSATIGNYILGYYPGSMTVVGGTSHDYVNMNGQGAIFTYNHIYMQGGTVYTNPGSIGDNVYGGESPTTIHGEGAGGSQYLILGNGGGSVYGGAGSDRIIGGSGNSVQLHAGSGNQVIDSGTGSGDQIFAGSGTDRIFVESASSTVTNSTGNDTISFSASGGTVILGAGNSTIYAGPATGGLTVTGGAGTGNDTVFAGDGPGNNVSGGSAGGTNILFGGTGVDVIHGGDNAGFNDIFGYLGNDIFYGGAGATNNYFNLTYDIHAGDADDIANWTNTATTHDWIFLPAAVQGATNFYQTGTDVVGYVAIGTGYYGLYINGATLADVTAHVFYS